MCRRKIHRRFALFGGVLRALVLGGACAFAGGASAQEARLGPGFCAAPMGAEEAASWPSRQASTDPTKAEVLLRFASCREIAEWRAGSRKRFDVYGYVTLGAQSAIGAIGRGAAVDRAAMLRVETGSVAVSDAAKDEDDAEAGAESQYGDQRILSRFRTEPRGRVDRRLDFIARVIEPGEARLLGAVLERRTFLSAAIERGAEPGERPVLRVAATTRDGDQLLTRTLVTPYRNGDVLRYMVAQLLAQAVVDEIVALNAGR